jgi:hypothetical protein
MVARQTNQGDIADTRRDDSMPESAHSLWREIREGFRSYRQARVDRKALERDLASYTSPRDIDDLEAMLAYYNEDETAAVRSILAARRA